ncbi:hypothetical protein H9L39_06117 [Fusarium oxysporum f. sp. albedinis]|nr:hypothetical protein H9L39_06117 [Fusarium oxysporum f. sp. albedinis]
MKISPAGRSSLISFKPKHRVFILADITNEPDDAESFCRYLTYANQFETVGVVAVTSTWLHDLVAPYKLRDIVGAYEKVVENLNTHAHPDSPYPSVKSISDVTRSGPPVYGIAAVGDDIPLSEGGELLLECLTSADTSPLWVLVWGGVNVLAHQWPDIFYICSVHGWNQYSNATWIGISGSVDEGGPDPSKVTKDWVREKIQIGPLGAMYPTPEYIIEGDIPTFLYILQNGLNIPEEPSYGSWGGRYVPLNISDKGISNRGHFCDTADTVVGSTGESSPPIKRPSGDGGTPTKMILKRECCGP